MIQKPYYGQTVSRVKHLPFTQFALASLFQPSPYAASLTPSTNIRGPQSWECFKRYFGHLAIRLHQQRQNVWSVLFILNLRLTFSSLVHFIMDIDFLASKGLSWKTKCLFLFSDSLLPKSKIVDSIKYCFFLDVYVSTHHTHFAANNLPNRGAVSNALSGSGNAS